MSLRSTILVTGGRGFIGTNLTERLAARHRVVSFDNGSRPSPTGGGGGSVESVITGDILDEDMLRNATEGADGVIHLAAYGSVVESVREPLPNLEVNVRGTFNVLRAVTVAGARRVVFASTGGALVGNASPPVSELSLPAPISPYGASKLCGEAYCQAFAACFDLSIACLRFGNVYGPHSAHKRGVVTAFIKALIRDEPLVIYGDGSASRDYIFVEDLCAGIEAALEADIEGCEIFHLATGHETTVLELATIMKDIAGRPRHPVEFRSSRKGEILRNFASYEKAKTWLGFEPKWELRDGLAATWEWFNAQGESILASEESDS